MATQDSFDYSAFAYVGILSGVAMAGKSEPSFGQGAAGYGNYFAHGFADNAIENYMVEAIVPSLTKEDPRYYTLGRGGFFKRSGYDMNRLFITRTDSGRKTFNISEVVGAGAAAGIGNAYYPADSNPFVKTYQHWLSQVIHDGLSNLVKEFWPDVNKAVFHHKNQGRRLGQSSIASLAKKLENGGVSSAPVRSLAVRMDRSQQSRIEVLAWDQLWMCTACILHLLLPTITYSRNSPWAWHFF